MLIQRYGPCQYWAEAVSFPLLSSFPIKIWKDGEGKADPSCSAAHQGPAQSWGMPNSSFQSGSGQGYDALPSPPCHTASKLCIAAWCWVSPPVFRCTNTHSWSAAVQVCRCMQNMLLFVIYICICNIKAGYFSPGELKALIAGLHEIFRSCTRDNS